MNYQKQHSIYERKAYRIIQYHIKKILNKIPYKVVSFNTYEATINANITEQDIYAMFKGIYTKRGYESRLLSRSMEDSVTVTSVLIPWNSCGMTQSTVLGVSTLAYFPYAVFNYVSPLMSVLIAVIGYKIKRSITDTSSDEN